MLLKLPFDLKVFLLDFLTHIDITTIKYILGRKLIYLSLKNKYKYLETEKLVGIVNNLFENCYKCNNFLKSNYILNTCNNCSMNINSKIIYPKMCYNCSDNLSIGKYKFMCCPVCSNLSFQLGIVKYN